MATFGERYSSTQNVHKESPLPIFSQEQITAKNMSLVKTIHDRLHNLHTQQEAVGGKKVLYGLEKKYATAHRYTPIEDEGSVRFIHYLDTGMLGEDDAKKEPILFLPGVVNGISEQLPMVSMLSHRRSIVVDYTTINPTNINEDISQILTAAGIDDPISMLTFSMGGTYAQHFIQQYPQKVKNMVAWAPVLLGGEAFGGREFHFLESLLSHKDLIPWFLVKTTHDLVSKTRFRRSGERKKELCDVDTSYSKVIKAALKKHLNLTKKQDRYKYLELALQATKESRGESTNKLGVHDLPVVLVRAEKDNVIKETNYKEWKNHFPHTTVVEVHSAFGHHSPENIPSQLIPVIAVALES